MAKKKATKKKVTKKSEPQEDLNAGKEKGDQLDLIDINPENAREIVKVARSYKEYQTARIKAQKGEEQQKQRVKDLVEEADLKPIEGGKIKFNYDGYTISLTPRDVLVQIEEETVKPPKE